MESLQSYMFGGEKTVERCERCGKGEVQMELVKFRTRGYVGLTPNGSERLCLACYGTAVNALKPEAPKPPRTLPYRTLAEANARADKVEAALGYRPDVAGNADTGYRVLRDAQSVTGFKAVA